jgi:hypothetical protein
LQYITVNKLINELYTSEELKGQVCAPSGDRGKNCMLKVYSEKEIFSLVMACKYPALVGYGKLNKTPVNDHQIWE